jgi:plasmid replication initiation protein
MRRMRGNENHKEEHAQLGESLKEGRDEMNLAEFPIGLITDRAVDGAKTVVYQDKDETLTVTGSDLLGLPTALDSDVIIALMHLTKAKNNFQDTTVKFTRYELLQVLGWPDRGYYYERLSESLNRWVGVTLVYKKSWWDNATKTKGNRSFHILEAATVVDRDERRALRDKNIKPPLSSVRWSKEFFQSFQVNNIKKLDLDTYFSLKSAVTKQLYRFLDKRFYRKSECQFDLRTLACEHVGISRNYETWRLKQKIQPAIDELTEIGYLQKMPASELFAKTGRNEWTVRLRKNRMTGNRDLESRPKAESRPAESKETNELVQELVRCGMAENSAQYLAKKYPEERIRRQIENLEFESSQGRITKPGGWLYRAIVNDYGRSDDFVSKADREKAALEKEELEIRKRALSQVERRQRVSEANRVAQDKRIQETIAAYWENLTRGEREIMTELAKRAADSETLSLYENQKSPALKEALLRKSIRDPYLRTKLGLGAAGAGEGSLDSHVESFRSDRI